MSFVFCPYPLPGSGAGVGGGAAAGGRAKMSGLKMAAMALGGSAGAVVAKELAVDPGREE